MGPNQENEILRNNEKIDGRVMPKFLCGTLLEDLPWDGLRKFGKLSVSTLSNNDLSWGSYWSPKLDDSTDKTKILIVDDDLEARFEILYLLLEDSTLRKSQIDFSSTLPASILLSSENQYDVIILDKILGNPFDDDTSNIISIPAIPKLLRGNPFSKIIMFTSSEDREDIVEAIKNGAFDYSVKGDTNELIVEKIKKALNIAKIEKDAEKQKRGIISRSTFFNPQKSKSSSMKKVLNSIDRIALSEEACLFLGESGVGKTEIARYLHEIREQSLFKEKRPFVEVNLSSFNKDTLLSELFGHKKGSFTGAMQDKIGLIELAHNGTLFIDEIGDVSLEVQGMLLKVIEENLYRRVGDTEKKRVSFKLICATNKNLEELIDKGHFREDFFNRINYLTVKIPSLSQRKEDIPEIIKTLIPSVASNARVSCEYEELPHEFINLLTNNPPKSNIRGIKAALITLLNFSPIDKNQKLNFKNWRKITHFVELLSHSESSEAKKISFDDLWEKPFDVLSDSRYRSLSELLKKIENKIVYEAKIKTKTHLAAARLLKIPPGSVNRKLEKIKGRRFWSVNEKN